MSTSQQKPPIFIASDHAGYELKAEMCAFLQTHYIVKDLGPSSAEAVDYPHYAHRLAEAVSNSSQSIGVLLCGTGNGMAMSANKHPNIRAAVCWSEELVRLARAHNYANILCLPARFLSKKKCEVLVECFLETPFEGGRHKRRVRQISLFSASV